MIRAVRCLVSVVLLSAVIASAQTNTPTAPQAAPSAASQFDVKAAVDAYLAKMPPDQRARSDAYFEGGYWLSLWSFLWSAGIFLFLLQTGLSTRMRDLAERATQGRALQTGLYWAQFAVVVAVLFFPLSVYRDYLREHRYGLSNLGFGAWIGEGLKGLALSIVLGGLAMMALYAVSKHGQCLSRAADLATAPGAIGWNARRALRALRLTAARAPATD